MPLCYLAIRTLCRNHRTSSLLNPRAILSPWRTSQGRRYGTAVEGLHKDEDVALDIGNVPTDFAHPAQVLSPQKVEQEQNDLRQDEPSKKLGAGELVQPNGTPSASAVKSRRRKRGRSPSSQSIKPRYVVSRPPNGQASITGKSTRRAAQPKQRSICQSILKHHTQNGSIGRQGKAKDMMHLRKALLRKRAKPSRTLKPCSWNRFWSLNYDRLIWPFGKRNKASQKIEGPLILASDTTALLDRVREHLLVPSPVGAASVAFVKLTRQQWCCVMIWLLHNEPENALLLLRKYSNTVGHPPLVLGQTLSYLAWYLSEKNDIAGLKPLVNVFLSLRQHEHLRLMHVFYRVMIQHCGDSELQELYKHASDNRRTAWPTLLHFASALSKRDQFDQALDCILEAKARGAPLDWYAFHSNCATLLRRASRQPGGLRVCLRILDHLLEVGFPLDNIIANIIMLNAVEAGDGNTAMGIYHSLVDHGLKGDGYTYAILLKRCKNDIDNAELLNEVIRRAIENVDISRDSVIVNEILHCLALHHTKHHPEKAFETVVDAYAQLCDLAPLEWLGLPLPKLSALSHPENPRPAPRRQAIHIILVTYLEQMYARSELTKPANDLYQRFKKLVEAGVEPFASMIEEDYIFNAFLNIFVKSKKGLLYAAQLVKDMQRPSDSRALIQQCKPTQQTWSIFLHGFAKHGQMDLAEQVLGYMLKKGIQPNRVTYNSLVGGYAAKQDLEGTLDTLRRLEANGHTWDEWTNSNIQRLKDRAKLEEEARKQREAMAMDFTSEIKGSIEAKLEEVEPPKIEDRQEEVAKQYFSDSADDTHTENNVHKQ